MNARTQTLEAIDEAGEGSTRPFPVSFLCRAFRLRFSRLVYWKSAESLTTNRTIPRCVPYPNRRRLFFGMTVSVWSASRIIIPEILGPDRVVLGMACMPGEAKEEGLLNLFLFLFSFASFNLSLCPAQRQLTLCFSLALSKLILRLNPPLCRN